MPPVRRNFSSSERTDMIMILGECHGNKRHAAQVYRQRYPDRHHPAANTFVRLTNNLRSYGCFRKPSVPSEEVLRIRQDREERVLASMYAHPHDSTEHVAQQLDMSQSTVLRILHKYKFHPYRIHLHQALGGNDGIQRINFCMTVRELLLENEDFTANVMFSDEASFHRDGTVNRHNLHYWAPTNPHWLGQDQHQVRWKVNVWCAIYGDRVIGPYFFPPTLNADAYLQFLRLTLSEEVLDTLPLAARARLWFQQDGAPPHNGQQVKAWLNHTFGRFWMGTHGPVPWPPRSPDLTPLDFFLWGFVKARVYETPSDSVQDLQNRIRRAIALVTPLMLRSVRTNFAARIEECVTADGWHFEHKE